MTDDITDLRRRVEALELWRATTAATTASGPLMTALCSALASCDPGTDPAAVASTIANWLDQQELHSAAMRLRVEVGQ